MGIGNVKVASTQYERALINAAKDGNASQVRDLLEAGTDPNVTDEAGNTPLIYGAKESAAIVDMLLYAGADPNIRNAYGSSPLMYAKKDRNEQLASLLQQYGATLTKEDEADIEKYFAQKEAARAQAASDGDSLGKTFLKGLVDAGMATMQYGIENNKF